MTSQRRPHWDDDLIVAVGDAIEHADPTVHPTVGMVNDVIAAVEDWVLSAPIFDLYLSRKHAPDKAAIQRVREVHEATVDDSDDPWQVAYATGWDAALKEVRRALEGDSDE